MTKEISIDKDVYEQLEARAKQKGMTANEYTVKIIHEMIDREEFIRINIIAPKCLLRLMKDQHYFGTTKEAFLIKCLQRGVEAELSELPGDECQSLEKEYHVNIDWSYIWLSIDC